MYGLKLDADEVLDSERTIFAVFWFELLFNPEFTVVVSFLTTSAAFSAPDTKSHVHTVFESGPTVAPYHA